LTAKNPGSTGMPNEKVTASKKRSQYYGVCWIKKSKKWRAQVNLKNEKKKV